MVRWTDWRCTHVPAAQGWTVQAPVFKEMALGSPVTASAGGSGVPVTAVSAERVRWTDAPAADSGVDGAAGSRAGHAAGRGNGGRWRGCRCAAKDAVQGRCPMPAVAGEGERGARE